MDEVLAACKKLNVRNILALRGDEPRESEYAVDGGSSKGESENGTVQQHGENRRFKHAVDLIRYIREQHGDYFCIGAAAYPEGHPTPSPAHPGGFYQSPEHDLPHLVEKVKAGADFLLTQLFYDVDKYLAFEKLLRSHESGVFGKIPVIPGLMPAQGWQSFSRTIKLARVGIPLDFQKKFQTLKGDDEGVKDAGVKVVTDIVNTIKERNNQEKDRKLAQGFHFYTLNLEKAVAQILEGTDLLPATVGEGGEEEEDEVKNKVTINIQPPTDDYDSDHQQISTADRRRRRSSTKNRVIASGSIPKDQKTDDYVFEEEAGKPRTEADEDSLAIAEGEGSLGRAATWDDFPNGRWGDARSPGMFFFLSLQHLENMMLGDCLLELGCHCSHTAELHCRFEKDLPIQEQCPPSHHPLSITQHPTSNMQSTNTTNTPINLAYNSANNYALHPNLAPSLALSLWSSPTSNDDITQIFHRYLHGSLAALPWSEDPPSPETATILPHLTALVAKGWWTMASQPAVNGLSSAHPVFGWGPKRGGFVYQKPFVEFFLPSRDWASLKDKLEARADEFTFFAGNAAGRFESSDEWAVNPVTWGVFKGKEIVTPTIVEAVSFREWQDEAFGIWREWGCCFREGSKSKELLEALREELWLVNVVGHDFVEGEGEGLWDVLLK